MAGGLLSALCPKEFGSMKPRMTVITIGVNDLEESLRFYRDGLGFPTGGIVGKEFEYGAVVFIDLHHGKGGLGRCSHHQGCA